VFNASILPWQRARHGQYWSLHFEHQIHLQSQSLFQKQYVLQMIAIVLASQLLCILCLGGLVAFALRAPSVSLSLVDRDAVLLAVTAGSLLAAASTMWRLLHGPANSVGITPGTLAGLFLAAILLWQGGLAMGLVLARRQACADEVRRAEEDRALSARIHGALELLGATRRMQRIGRSVFHDVANGRESVLQWQGDERPEAAAFGGFRATEWKSYTWREPDHQIRLSAIAELDAITRDFPDRRRSINQHLANFARSNQRNAACVDAPA
jgi:hypothetical protein